MNKREWMLQAALANMANPRPALNAVEHFSEMYDAICAASPETPQEGAWVEHDGDVSKAPEEGRMVEVEFRDGGAWVGNSATLGWAHLDVAMDVVRWRYA